MEGNSTRGRGGMLFRCCDCPDLNTSGRTGMGVGSDHFKYSCRKWKSRCRLQHGFSMLHNMGFHQGPYHLNNQAINAMIARGVTLERVAKQPKKWLPNEPLYDRNVVTGAWESTGIVPTQVWFALPSEMRLEPVPQDNSMEARAERAADPRDGAVLNAPPHIEEAQGFRELEIFYEAQCEVRDALLPNYQALVAEHEALLRNYHRLRNQVANMKHHVNLLAQLGWAGPLNVVQQVVDAGFNQPGHSQHIPAMAVNPAAPLNVPNTVAKQNADADYCVARLFVIWWWNWMLLLARRGWRRWGFRVLLAGTTRVQELFVSLDIFVMVE